MFIQNPDGNCLSSQGKKVLLSHLRNWIPHLIAVGSIRIQRFQLSSLYRFLMGGNESVSSFVRGSSFFTLLPSFERTRIVRVTAEVPAVSHCQVTVHCHNVFSCHRHRDVAQSVQHRSGTMPTQVRFPGSARDFSCRLSYGVRKSSVYNRMH